MVSVHELFCIKFYTKWWESNRDHRWTFWNVFLCSIEIKREEENVTKKLLFPTSEALECATHEFGSNLSILLRIAIHFQRQTIYSLQDDSMPSVSFLYFSLPLYVCQRMPVLFVVPSLL